MGSPAATELINRQLAAGISPNEVFVPLHPPGRARRDFARFSDFLLPGAGNFVSGDSVTEQDVVDLGLSVGRTLALGLLGPETGGVRAAVEANEIADAARVARAAALRGTPTRGAGPVVGKLNPSPPPRISQIEPPPADKGVNPASLYVEPAIVPLTHPYPEAARDLREIRERLKISNLHTIAVARTNLPGLENRLFWGASPEVREVAGLPPAEPEPIKSPFRNPQFVGHAEEGAGNHFMHDLRELAVRPQNMKGYELRMHVSKPPCPSCRAGLANEDGCRPECGWNLRGVISEHGEAI